MNVQTLDSRYDSSTDEMRFPYPFNSLTDSEVRICRAAMVQGEAKVKARIKGYFKYHERPQPGTSMRIDDYHFDPNLFQPEQWD